MAATTITIETTISAPIEKVWEIWTTPEHITKWNSASDDWISPRAENDLQPGGKFIFRMEAKDGSVGFDFEGTYDEVKTNELLVYSIADGRKVSVTFSGEGEATKVVEVFEPESVNPPEMQQAGWQAILDSFKKYVEQTK